MIDEVMETYEDKELQMPQVRNKSVREASISNSSQATNLRSNGRF